jgi:hypothetical protein
MAEIEIVTIDVDELDDETRALFERCMSMEPVDLRSALTDEIVAEAMIATDLVRVRQISPIAPFCRR